MMGFGFIFMILIWGIIIVGAIWVGKNVLDQNGLFNNPKPTSHRKSALEILENRYARGEISREEFEAMKEDITIFTD